MYFESLNIFRSFQFTYNILLEYSEYMNIIKRKVSQSKAALGVIYRIVVDILSMD